MEATEISRFLVELFTMPETKACLKNVDIVTEKISSELYVEVRSLVSTLTSLTIRRAFRISHGHIWGPFKGIEWSSSSQLQRLNLIDCSNAYAPLIPELVGHFKSLRYLIVSTCGDETDVMPELRSPGWSRLPDALCNQHAPLDELHFERMYEWEISAIGTIPTKRLMISSSDKMDLISVLESDKELFPGLQYVGIAEELRFRYQQPIPMEEWEASESTQASYKLRLSKLCIERDVRLNWDAEPITKGHR